MEKSIKDQKWVNEEYQKYASRNGWINGRNVSSFAEWIEERLKEEK